MQPAAHVPANILKENEELRLRLEEAEDMLRAIRGGEGDALVIQSTAGLQVYTLPGQDADANRLRGEMLAQVADAVIVVDESDRIVYLNAAAERLYDLAASKTLGRPLIDVFSTRWRRPDDETAAAIALRERGEWHGETVQVRHEGRELEVELSITDASGVVTGISVVADEITDRKNAEAALQASETRLSRILKQSPAGIVQTDAEGRIVLVNNCWCEMLGYGESEMLGVSVIDLTHPSSVEATLESIGRLAKGGPDFQIEQNYRRKDGAMIRCSSSVAALRDDEGNYQGLLAVVLDMTKRLGAEDRLRESEQRFRGIFDSTFQFIGLLSPDGTLLEANQPALQFAGLAADDIVGRPFWEARWWAAAPVPGTPAQLQAAIAEAASGKFVRYEVEVRGMGEHTMIIDFSLRPILDANGHITLIVPEGRDITERKRQEEHIRMLMGEVNHRSKNMLSLVQAIAKRTVATRPEDFIERFGQRVQALAANQDLLVRNEWKAVPLGELVRSQLAHFGDALDTRVALDGPPVEITASASQALGMTLHELATNATKYGALSNEVGRVAIGWRLRSDAAGKGRLTMSWIESGGPPVARPTRQGFGSTVTGTMIKMSLGCDVEVDFAPNGLVWRIDCPAAGIVEGNALSVPQWNGAAAAEEPAQASGRRRVLVVEDEPLIAMDIALTLAEAGYDVIGPAHSVAMALALIAQSGCDAAVLDINLGAETAEPVARELIRRGMPFITTSGYMREQQPEIMRTAPLLGKPLRPELLTAEIARCLGR